MAFFDSVVNPLLVVLLSGSACYAAFSLILRLRAWRGTRKPQSITPVKPPTSTASESPIDVEVEKMIASLVPNTTTLPYVCYASSGSVLPDLNAHSTFSIVGEGRLRTVVVTGTVIACEGSFATINLGSADGVSDNALIDVATSLTTRRKKNAKVRWTAVLVISRVEQYVSHGRCFGEPVKCGYRVHLKIKI